MRKTFRASAGTGRLFRPSAAACNIGTRKRSGRCYETVMNSTVARLLRIGAILVAAAVSGLASNGAWAQAGRTIKLIVPYQPGGGNDILARLLAEHIGRTQGPSVVIENRAGGGSVIGTEAVARAAPDGNTLLLSTADVVITPHLRKLSYDPLTAFEPVCYLVDFPLLLVVNGASPFRTLADLLAAARAKPNTLTLAANGPATAYHIAFETFKRVAKIDMIFVPYAGTAPAVTALLGEHVTAFLGSYPAVIEQVSAGKLRALATPSRQRIELLPDLPTVAESGFPDYEAVNWIGVLAPAKTPRDLLAQLADWMKAAVEAPDVRAKLSPQGLFPAAACGADFAAILRRQYDAYGRAIREAGLRAE